MPSLGADMDAGTLVAWHRNPGDRVGRGELIADVETDKGIIAVESFTNGVLEKQVAQIGARVPVGTVLALIRDDDAVEPAQGQSGSGDMRIPNAAQTQQVTSPKQDLSVTNIPTASLADTETHSPIPEMSRVPMSPSARRLARELGVDPHSIYGTGPGGAVTREDIEQAAHPAVTPTAAPVAHVESVPSVDRQARMRQTIAAAMSRSKREIPHYYLSTTIDMNASMTWLAEYNEARPVAERLLYGVLLIKAVACSLRVVPELNAIWDGQQVARKQQIHIGTAISLRQGGLMAPAIHDADQKSLDELMAAFRDLVARTRAGGLRASELSDPTITVTSLGENGVETVFGVIYPPQVAIVGFGKIVERPWSINGGILSRPVITATLSADHRVSDGHRGGLFLATIDKLLQEPSQL